MTTRDELEAVIWQQLRLSNAKDALPAVDAILDAADAYAVTQGGITAERRQALAEAVAASDGRARRHD
jgi:hypothetical protein